MKKITQESRKKKKTLTRRDTFTISGSSAPEKKKCLALSKFGKFHDILRRSSPQSSVKQAKPTRKKLTAIFGDRQAAKINVNCDFALQCFVNTALCTGISFYGLRASKSKLFASLLSKVIGACGSLLVTAAAIYFYYTTLVIPTAAVRNQKFTVIANTLLVSSGAASQWSLFLFGNKLVLLIARYSSLNVARNGKKCANRVMFAAMAAHLLFFICSLAFAVLWPFSREDSSWQGLVRQLTCSYSVLINRTLTILLAIECCRFAGVHSKLASDVKHISSRSILSSARMLFAQISSEHHKFWAQFLSVALTLDLISASFTIGDAALKLRAANDVKLMVAPIWTLFEHACKLMTLVVAARQLTLSAEKLSSVVMRLDVQRLDSDARQEVMLFATISHQCSDAFRATSLLMCSKFSVPFLAVVVGNFIFFANYRP